MSIVQDKRVGNWSTLRQMRFSHHSAATCISNIDEPVFMEIAEVGMSVVVDGVMVVS